MHVLVKGVKTRSGIKANVRVGVRVMCVGRSLIGVGVPLLHALEETNGVERGKHGGRESEREEKRGEAKTWSGKGQAGTERGREREDK